MKRWLKKIGVWQPATKKEQEDLEAYQTVLKKFLGDSPMLVTITLVNEQGEASHAFAPVRLPKTSEFWNITIDGRRSNEVNLKKRVNFGVAKCTEVITHAHVQWDSLMQYTMGNGRWTVHTGDSFTIEA